MAGHLIPLTHTGVVADYDQIGCDDAAAAATVGGDPADL